MIDRDHTKGCLSKAGHDKLRMPKTNMARCLPKAGYDKLKMPKTNMAVPKWTWQEDRSGLRQPMKANCNGGTETEMQSACVQAKVRFGT